MRFDLTQDQELLRETTRRFLEREFPLTRVREAFSDRDGFPREWWRAAAELGWISLAVPEEDGGISLSGGSGRDLSIVAEEMGRMVSPGPFLPSAVCAMALAASKESAHKEELLSRVLTGELIPAWAFGEPGSCWEPSRFAVRLEASDGGFILTGTKAYVEFGAQADILLVTAQSSEGLTQIILPMSHEGVHVTRGRSLDFVRRYACVSFHRVRVPQEALLGEPGSAEMGVERQLQLALLLQCAETNGAVERAYESTVDYMRQRYAFGRPIASYQALKHRLADMLLWLHSCMATTDSALDAHDRHGADASVMARVAKAYVAAKSTSILSDLVQMTGGIAVTWEHDIHLYERRVAVNRAVLGTPELHRGHVSRHLAA
jgi:alkylation response protein AidB-like acyl-CoA dehydrogenase